MSFIRACIHHVIIVLSGPDPRPQRNNREPSLGVFCIWGPLIRLLLTITAVSGLAGWWHRMSVLSNDGCHLIVRCCVSQFFLYTLVRRPFPVSDCTSIPLSEHHRILHCSFLLALPCMLVCSVFILPLCYCCCVIKLLPGQFSFWSAARLLDEAFCRRNIKVVLHPLGCVNNIISAYTFQFFLIWDTQRCVSWAQATVCNMKVFTFQPF